MVGELNQEGKMLPFFNLDGDHTYWVTEISHCSGQVYVTTKMSCSLYVIQKYMSGFPHYLE